MLKGFLSGNVRSCRRSGALLSSSALKMGIQGDVSGLHTNHTLLLIYIPRRWTSHFIFAKSCTFGAAILTINDFLLHPGTGHTETLPYSHEHPQPPTPPSHSTRDGSVSSRSLPILQPFFSLTFPISSQLVSRSKARYPLYSDGLVVVGALFLLTGVGGKISFCCLRSSITTYTYIYKVLCGAIAPGHWGFYARQSIYLRLSWTALHYWLCFILRDELAAGWLLHWRLIG